ncbi:MAG TPA: hypothetical protein PLN56_11370 [Methanoregulaceae archaeon]|nr:hypothetical protein [Methanothrix sp.]HOL44682.1 hypothetical protein [Methanothrix sp.]HON93690.1 hypothetical protein [Sedimentisphaerales bacterium]HPD11580.1 hypothetical protein [Methanoregulaceae archaeon]HRT52158.1 hypothetical protein [Anaerohalosphaeraceae bacterium]
MSHTMNVRIELHDRDALEAACQRLGLTIIEGKHKLYSSTEEGLGIRLPGWKYPVVIKDGTVAYDNYRGSWGKLEELNKLRAYYGLEKAKMEARKRGYSVYESFNGNTQELELRIRVGG